MSGFLLKSQMTGPLTLYKSSAIQISKQLWAQPDCKRLLILCIKNYESQKSESTPRDSQNGFNTQMTHKIDELILPGIVKDELKLIVTSMGTRLCEWAEEMRKLGAFSVDLAHYIHHICWAYYGSIDVSATVKSMYLSNVFPEDMTTWNQLCKLCLEDCIKDLWPKVSEHKNDKDARILPLISIYWEHRMLNSLEKLGPLKLYMPKGFSLEENMFQYSFRCGYYPAVQYFWRLLNDDQKKRTIIETANDIIFSDRFYGLQSDLAVFLIQQLFVYELDHLWKKLMGKHACCKHVLLAALEWPYQSLFMMAVEESWMHESIDYTSIINAIIESIHCSFLMTGTDRQYRELFHGLWERIVSDGRRSVNFLVVLESLWRTNNVTLLNYIINHPRLKEKRESHISHIMQLFASVVDYQNEVSCNEFVSKVLVSEEERERFRSETVESNVRFVREG